MRDFRLSGKQKFTIQTLDQTQRKISELVKCLRAPLTGPSAFALPQRNKPDTLSPAGERAGVRGRFSKPSGTRCFLKFILVIVLINIRWRRARILRTPIVDCEKFTPCIAGN